jgi:hypothetical protein
MLRDLNIILHGIQEEFPELSESLNYAVSQFLYGKRLSKNDLGAELLTLIFEHQSHAEDLLNPTRGQIWLKTKGRCLYCYAPFNLGDYWEIEHLIPIGRGGGNSFYNLFVSCPKDNRKKGNKTSIEYIGTALGLAIPQIYNCAAICHSEEMFAMACSLHKTYTNHKYIQLALDGNLL